MNFFNNIDFAPTLGHIRDRGQIKFVDVYTYRKEGNNAPVVVPFLPTPLVDFISNKEFMESGGVIAVGEIVLRQIPVSRYKESDLQTSTLSGRVKRYWILSDPKSEPKAYTTTNITRGPLFWEVVLERYKSINEEKLEQALSRR